MTIHVVVADDHDGMRAALVRALSGGGGPPPESPAPKSPGTKSPDTASPGTESPEPRTIVVTGVAANGTDAIRAVLTAPCDVALIDLRMPGMSSAKVVAALRARAPTVRVLVTTTHLTDRNLSKALEAGAVGYLLKTSPAEAVVAGVRDAAAGQTLVARDELARLRGLTHNEAPRPLTDREKQVLRLMAFGMGSREIALRLNIGQATAKMHILNVYGKLAVHDRASAIDEAARRGLLDPTREP